MIKSLMILLLFAVLHFIVALVARKLKHKAEHSKFYWQASILHASLLPFLCLIWLFALSLMADLFSTAHGYEEIIPYIVQARTFLIILLLAWCGLRWEKQITRLFTQDYAGLIAKLVTIAILSIAAILALQALGVNLQALIAIGGISGLSLGFACKDIFSNFFASLTLAFTKPFVVGEIIELPDRELECRVQAIGWYYTSLISGQKKQIYLPNSVFSKSLIINNSRISHWNIEERFYLRYQDMGRIAELTKKIEQVLSGLPEVDCNEKILVYLSQLGSSTPQIYLSFYLHPTADRFASKQAVLLQIADLVEASQAEFAPPVLALTGH